LKRYLASNAAYFNPKATNTESPQFFFKKSVKPVTQYSGTYSVIYTLCLQFC
jgi:hypothetical protein